MAEGQQFMIQRPHDDHPQIPDALAVLAFIDANPTTHYSDVRGIHRPFTLATTYCRLT